MKSFLHALLRSLLAAAALTGTAAAQSDIAGTWQGRLDAAPGTTLTIQFVIKAAPGGGYTAVVTSPDSGAIKNVPAKSAKFADNRLTIDVPALSGGYSGTLRNGAIEGEWLQQGQKLPLSLRPLETSSLTREEIDALRGEWNGPFKAMGLQVTIILKFSTNSAGVLRAVLDIPEQGVKDWETKDLTLDDGHFAIKIPAALAEIKGVLKGNEIVGQWSQMGNGVPLTMKKGKHVVAPVYLGLPAAARDKLAGRWNGTLGPLNMTVRVEVDAQGRTQAFFDNQQQNTMGIPVTELSLTGTKMTMGIAGFGAKFTGDLAGDKIAGEWSQMGMPKPAPLTFTREKKPEKK